MDFDNVEETEQIKAQLAKKIAHLQEEMQSAEPQVLPYLKEKLDLLESEWESLEEKPRGDRGFVRAQDFSSK